MVFRSSENEFSSSELETVQTFISQRRRIGTRKLGSQHLMLAYPRSIPLGPHLQTSNRLGERTWIYGESGRSYCRPFPKETTTSGTRKEEAVFLFLAGEGGTGASCSSWRSIDRAGLSRLNRDRQRVRFIGTIGD